MIQDYIRLRDLGLNKKENSVMKFIMKNDFIRNTIKEEINFE